MQTTYQPSCGCEGGGDDYSTQPQANLDAVGAGDDVTGTFSGGRGNSWDRHHQISQGQCRVLRDKHA